MVKRVCAFVVLLGAVACGGVHRRVSAVPVPVAAARARVNCGDTIVVSTVLDADVNLCPGQGLIIGADGVTLDFGGHVLTSLPGNPHSGVLVDAHTGVSIVNGTVINFAHGVVLQNGANGNVIRNVATTGSFFNGISVLASGGNLIEDCQSSGSGAFGIGLNAASNGNTVRRCTVTGSHSSGIFIGGGGGRPPSSNNLVSGNSVHDNVAVGPAISIYGSSNNTVEGNDVVRNGVGVGGHGIGVSTGSHSNTVRNNHSSNNSALGISINNTSLNNQVAGNTVVGNTGNGIDVSTSSTGNVVANNTVTGNLSNGIAVTTASSNTVTANQVTGNALSGILIGSGSNANQVVNNTASGNTRFDLEDRTRDGGGTAGTQNSHTSNICTVGSPAPLCGVQRPGLPAAAAATPSAALEQGGTDGNSIVNGGGKCLDVDAPNMRNDGGRVQVWTCNQQPRQRWRLVGGAIVNASGKCLDVDAPNMRNDGGRVQVWSCNEQPQQQWRLVGRAIVNASGKCLDVDAQNMLNDGARVQVWSCNEQPQQHWLMFDRPIVEPTTQTGIVQPRLLRDVKPQYTAEAMRAKIQGIVTLECVVGRDGVVGEIKVVRSGLVSELQFDTDPKKAARQRDDVNRGISQLEQEAIKAMRQWRFAPGTREGVPLDVRITSEMTFALR